MFKVLAAAGVLLCPAMACAQSAAGPYVSGQVGANVLGSLDGVERRVRFDTDVGPAVIGAVGWRLANGLRFEAEGSYRSNGVSQVDTLRQNGTLEPITGQSGGVKTYAAMANVLYDLPTRLPLGIRPYVGAGVGYGWFDASDVSGQEPFNFSLPQNNTFSGPANRSWGSGSALAYQAMVGFTAPLPVNGLELTAGYRFFGMARTTVPTAAISVSNNTVNGTIPAFSNVNEFEPRQHAVTIGLLYRFGR